MWLLHFLKLWPFNVPGLTIFPTQTCHQALKKSKYSRNFLGPCQNVLRIPGAGCIGNHLIALVQNRSGQGQGQQLDRPRWPADHAPAGARGGGPGCAKYSGARARRTENVTALLEGDSLLRPSSQPHPPSSPGAHAPQGHALRLRGAPVCPSAGAVGRTDPHGPVPFPLSASHVHASLALTCLFFPPFLSSSPVPSAVFDPFFF